MSVYVYAENIEGVYKKTTLEAISFAKSIAEKNGENLVAIAINPTENPDILYNYGVNELVSIQGEGLAVFDANVYVDLISQEIDSEGVIVFPHSVQASSLAAMLAIKIDKPLISNVIELPENLSPIKIKRKVFSSKAFQLVEVEGKTAVLTLVQNSFGLKENQVSGQERVKNITESLSKIKLISKEKNSTTIDLKEADVVVSAGRGLKGAENWHLVEDLASVLGAATACSKPVSDIGWRSHSEHVGQTGKVIAPKLYIAVGISGAIQHLAGVNSSKTIVVINSDPEAPFFKSADYGVVGDAFKILPELTQKIKEVKG